MKFSIKFLQRLTELEEGIEMAEECIFESIAQYQSEVAMFGDGGPGSHPSLIDYTSLNADKAELKALCASAGGKALAAFQDLSDTITRAWYRTNTTPDAIGDFIPD
jgi:hypothetical protein